MALTNANPRDGNYFDVMKICHATDEQIAEAQQRIAAFMVEYRKTPAYKPCGWRDKPQPKEKK